MPCLCCAMILFATFVAVFVLLERRYRRGLIAAVRGKSVLITGTDTGFGRKLALDLDKLGVNVYAGCYTDEGAENLKIGTENITTFKLDVTSDESVEKAKEFVKHDLESKNRVLWGLVNNAGITSGIFFALSSMKHYKQVMDVNFYGVVRITEAFLPLIKKSKGRIVNIISMMGRCAVSTETYSCAKHALEPYNDGLRRHMRSYGAHVAAIEPGFFPTNLTSIDNNCEKLRKEWSELPQDLTEEYGGEDAFQAVIADIKMGLNATKSRRNHPGMVTEAITHALFAKHPKCRYVCGLDAQFIRIYPFIPDWFLDFVIGNVSHFAKILRRKQRGRH